MMETHSHSAPLRAQSAASWDDSTRVTLEGPLRRITLDAPVVDLTTAVEFLPPGPRVCWSPGHGRQLVGSGLSWSCSPAGPTRFEQLIDAAGQLFDRLEDRPGKGAASAPARILGGFAFDSGGAQEYPWNAFGDGWFCLPRWTYETDGVTATLGLVLPESALRKDPSSPLVQLETLLRQLENPSLLERPQPSTALRGQLTELSPSQWKKQVEDIRAAIASGRFDKIVAARRSDAQFEQAPSPREVFSRLHRAFPSCFRFAFERPGACFLGATPERLLVSSGDLVHTEALAGSIRAEGAAAVEKLLASSKDLIEHRLVVDDILRRLEPYCDTLAAAEVPSVRQLRHIFHLLTPIEGRLKDRVHVLKLVEALHPTPAVGGVPQRESVDWIRTHEARPRGWYSGPIGWMDSAGQGEFAVALRSGLLFDRQAWIYAGAGIVSSSDPDLEYAETGLKQQALLSALGMGE